MSCERLLDDWASRVIRSQSIRMLTDKKTKKFKGIGAPSPLGTFSRLARRELCIDRQD